MPCFGTENYTESLKMLGVCLAWHWRPFDIIYVTFGMCCSGMDIAQKNKFSDFLSRKDGLHNSLEVADMEEETPIVICAMRENQANTIFNLGLINDLDFKNEQNLDPELQIIKNWKKEEKNVTEEDLKEKSLRFKRLAGILFKIKIQNNLLYVENEDLGEREKFRIIVPKNLETKVVELEARHLKELIWNCKHKKELVNLILVNLLIIMVTKIK